MKKRMLLVLSCILIICACACSKSGGKEEKEDNPFNSQDKNACMTEIGITYTAGLLTGSNENTEVTIYIDDIEVGKMNRGYKRVFVAKLAPGEHEVKMSRAKIDKDKYTFEIPEDNKSEMFVGLKYTFHWLTGQTDLEESDFPREVGDDEYIWLMKGDTLQNDNDDSAQAEQNEPALTEEVDITEIIQKNPDNMGDIIIDLEEKNVKIAYDENENMYMTSDNLFGVCNYQEQDVDFFAFASMNPKVVMYNISCGLKIDEADTLLLEQGRKMNSTNATDDENKYSYIIDNNVIEITEDENDNTVCCIIVYLDIANYYENDTEYESESDELSDEYIIPYSSEQYISEDDLVGLDEKSLSIAINEIYARHGRIFSDDKLNEYFSSQEWYTGTVTSEEFDESVLNDYEKKNIDVMAQYREKLKN